MKNRTSKLYTKTFVDHNGIRHYARGKTLEEAIVKRERMKAEIEKGRKTSSTPFKVWAETALETCKPDVTEKYRKTIEYRLEKHINPSIGHLPIGTITPVQCQQVLNTCKAMSKSHIMKLSSELFFYFDTARKNGLIQRNPAEDVVRPKGIEGKRRALTREEREAFLRICEKFPGKFIVFQLMLYCGCRPAEAYGVKYEDVVERNGVKYLHIRGTKTANSDRFVPMYKEVGLLLDKNAEGLVALTEGGCPYNDTSYKRLSKRLKREMDIELGATVYRNQIVESVIGDFVPYYFRHTFCTDLKKKGVDVRIARDLMGHSSIKTTANIYDHADDETLVLAAEQMGVV